MSPCVDGRASNSQSEVWILSRLRQEPVVGSSVPQPLTEVMLMVEIAELVIAAIEAIVTVIGVVHTLRRDKQNDQKHKNSRPGFGRLRQLFL
jgi:hypothetical protein